MFKEEVIENMTERLADILGQMLQDVVVNGYDNQPTLTQEIKDVIKKAKTKTFTCYLSVVIRSYTKPFQKYIYFVLTDQKDAFIKDNQIVIPIMKIDKDSKRSNYKEIWYRAEVALENVLSDAVIKKIERLNDGKERYKAVDYMTNIIKHYYYRNWSLKSKIENNKGWLKALYDESKVIMTLTES
jgi:hypothetical protein